MKVEFVRFNASDDVEPQSWFSDPGGELAAVHVHGMSGNGYENYFLDTLRNLYSSLGIAFFTFDNRGRGVISEFKKGRGSKLAGSCYEIFEESVHDIQGAIDYLKRLGKKKFVLQGHSLGASKIVSFVVSKKAPEVAGLILLAPTDMVGWAKVDSRHNEYFAKAIKLLASSKAEELVGAQCWWNKTPLSAQTYKSITEDGGAVDMYKKRASGSLLSIVSAPMLVVYGDKDIGITKVDGDAETWQKRIEGIINKNTEIAILPGATHSFKDHEEKLAAEIDRFLKARQFA